MRNCQTARWGFAIILGLFFLAPAHGEEQDKKTVTVVPDSRLAASGINRFFLGNGYRELWTTSIEAEYLDLRTYAGGLTPTGTGKGMQSLGLRFIGADGKPYTFRPLKKSLLDLLPAGLKETYVADVTDDQVKSAMPTAPPVIPVLLDAVNVLHNTPKIIVIPDDPILGEYREYFAGQVGTIEEWPNEGSGGTPGFAGATEVHSTDELIEVLKSDPAQQIDARSFLTARLVDLVIGDWDRHRGQWRWANVGEGSPPAWMPIPEDRDQAFAKYDGVLFSVARLMVPQLTNFGPKYNSILGMTWNGRTVDRQLLVGLSKSDWEMVAQSVRSRLEDSIIDEALGRLPKSHYDLAAMDTAANLRIRRDKLPEIAEKYYRHLAGEVDISATEKSDTVEASRLDGGRLDVSIYATKNGKKLSTPYFHRIFDPDDTKNVRIFLHGGNDQVDISGEGGNKIKLRIISGVGEDKVTDRSRTRGTKVYDPRKENGVVAQGAKVNQKPYTPPKPAEFQLPARDWGKKNLWTGVLDLNGDIGLLLGMGINHQRYGFRRNPYASNWSSSLAYSTKLQHVRIKAGYAQTKENSSAVWGADFMLSGIESVNYFGLGNETPAPEDENFAYVNRRAIHLQPFFNLVLAPQLDLRIEALFEQSQTVENPDSIIGIEDPYGTGDFWQAGLRARLIYDTLDNSVWPSRGLYFRASGDYFPEVMDIEEGQFGSFEGLLGGALPLTRGFVIAGKVGGRKVWGHYPYSHAAYIGGRETLRGYAKNRFAGDSSIYASIDLRLPISKIKAKGLILPGEWGLFGFVDTGRVFLQGEESDKWHTGYGGGIWIAPPIRQFTISLAVAGSDEGTRIYLSFGFGY